jgi:hypothetical protein
MFSTPAGEGRAATVNKLIFYQGQTNIQVPMTHFVALVRILVSIAQMAVNELN